MKPIASGIFLAVLWAGAAKAEDTERLLKAAINTELMDGDLKGAIEQYKTISQRGTPAAAAAALLRMGKAYDKLGDPQAKTAYQRVVAQYGDRPEAAQARALLSATQADGKSGVTTTQVQQLLWSGMRDRVPAISTDGRYLVYSYADSGMPALHCRDLATGEDRVIATADREGASIRSPQVSPEGKQVAYSWSTPQGSQLRLVGLDGSGIRTVLAKDLAIPRAWSPDGKSVLVQRWMKEVTSNLAMVSVADGHMTVLQSGVDIGATANAISPDGRYIVYHRQENVRTSKYAVWIMNPDGSGAAPLVIDSGAAWSAQGAMWTPDGRNVVFASDRSGSWAFYSLHVVDGKPHGTPERLAQNAETAGALRITADGSLFYVNELSEKDVYTADFDPATLKAVSTPERVNQRNIGSISAPDVALSPDGRSAIYAGTQSSAKGVLTLHSLATGQEREINPKSEMAFPQHVSYFPDGRSVLTFDYAKQETWVRRIDVQTGEATPIFHLPGREPHVHWQPALSPDGKSLFYSTSEWDKSSGLGTIRLIRRNLESAGEKTLVEIPSRGSGIFSPTVSPDGRQVAFIYIDVNNSTPLVIVPSEGGAPREIVRGVATILGTAWSKDSRRILFAKAGVGQNGLYAISISGGEAEPVGIQVPGVRGFSLSRENDRIAFVAGKRQTDLWVYRNLFPPAKQQ